MVSTSDFRPGLTIEVDGRACQIVQCDHHKLVGRGGAIMRTKLRDLLTGAITERTFRSGERFPRALLERSQMQFVYATGDGYVFMDNETYEQIELTAAQVGDDAKWLKEGEDVQITTHQGQLIGIELPNTVERKVLQTDPGLRGDTASGGTKPALVEGNVTVNVPLFISVGEVLKIDTRTGEYLGRVSS